MTEPLSGPADSRFLRACRGEPVDATPVWFMRQAGRSLPEYRAVRGEGSIVETIADPDRATEITLQPVRRYGVDAAILYSDIVTPVQAIGFGVTVEPGVGPVVADPFRSADDLGRLRDLNPEVDTPYVLETVRNLTQELSVPLIGFAGAPFTVASYLVEGGPSKHQVLTKSLMLTNPRLWAQLLDRLADIAITSLASQVASGAQAVQLFDSWAGNLTPSQYEQHVLPASTKVLQAAASFGVPRIHFGLGTGEILSLMASAGADVMGIDWHVPIDVARERVGPTCAVQGNLDPAVVLAGWDATRSEAADILTRNHGRPGHVFNLGHGVLPDTDPVVLERLVEFVHGWPVGGSVS